MVDWYSPAELLVDIRVARAILFCEIGLWAWEYIITFHWEWNLLQGKLAVGTRWPTLLMMTSRYSLPVVLILQTVLLEYVRPMNCQAVLTALLVFGALCISASSSIFALRCVALWDYSPLVVWGLGIAWIVQTALWFAGSAEIGASYLMVPGYGGGCHITQIHKYVAVEYAYAEVFEVAVFVLSMHKIFKEGRRSNVGRLLMAEGFIYFGLAVLTHTMVLAWVLLAFNPMTQSFLMSVNVLSIAVSSNRAYMSLAYACNEGRPRPVGVLMTEYHPEAPSVHSDEDMGIHIFEERVVKIVTLEPSTPRTSRRRPRSRLSSLRFHSGGEDGMAIEPKREEGSSSNPPSTTHLPYPSLPVVARRSGRPTPPA